jgi:hypothetical protein
MDRASITQGTLPHPFARSAKKEALWKLTELWKNKRTVFPQLLEPSVHSFHNAGYYWSFGHNISFTPGG